MAANLVSFDRGLQGIGDPHSPENMGRANRQQLLSDILRNAVQGVPEAALTMGTGLADMAGTGLGTLAGMAASKLRGEPVDMDAAAEGMTAGKFTYQPRTEGGQETLRGLETVMAPLERGMQWAGEKTTDVTGSPALGAGVYTALNVVDPTLAAPAAAKVAALRGASGVAREAAKTAVPMSEALRNIPPGQRGAYSLEDLTGTEGDFSFKSPTLLAFDRLKPQEQGRVSGKQLRSALMREGAKKEELTWMGLDDVLDSAEPLSTADVRKLAETNAPEFEFASARATRDGEVELDDDAVSEKAYEMARDDPDLAYGYDVRDSNGDHLETFGSEREANRFVERQRESYVEDNLESEIDNYIENANEYLDADELAAMSEADVRSWAEEHAKSSLEDQASDLEFSVDIDYDSDPHNLESLREHWEEQIRENPDDYGIEGTGSSQAPSYGQYTVGRQGEKPEGNYTVSAGRLAREERFGKGGTEPDFLRPYLHAAEQPELLSSPDQMALFTNVGGQDILTPQSKAFQIEALRRTAREADPNAERYRKDSTDRHYSELGDNQMFFTRETDAPAPSWGSVQEGIGRVEGGDLKLPGGEDLPQMSELNRPTRLVEESQSDWLQKGRKTGWAEPKFLQKALADNVNETARVDALRVQALNELPSSVEDSRIASFIDKHRQLVARAEAADMTPAHESSLMMAALDDFIDKNQTSPHNYTVNERVTAADQLFSRIYQYSEGGSETEAFARQIRDGLRELPRMTSSPISSVTPSSPMRDTRQYTQLAMADALRRAVQEGQQYLAWTPGDVHTKRWGTDTFQYAPSPENPRLIRWSQGGGDGGALSLSPDQTGNQLLQGKADRLLTDDSASLIDLDDPDVDTKLRQIVSNHLDYGMHEYPNPDLQRTKRAAQLRKDLEAASAAAAGGESKAAHYSPRAFGYDSAYGPTGDDVLAILRRSGVKELPEIRDIPSTGGKTPLPLRGFEIDPEVARAVKRGLTLPY